MTTKQKSRTHDTSNDVFQAAFERYEGERNALDDGALTVINVDIPTAVTTALGALKAMREIRPALVATYGKFDTRQFDAMEGYTRALMHSHGAYLAASAPPSDLAALYEEGNALREMLVSDASALAKRSLLDPRRLVEFRGAAGYRNLATELVGLSAVLLEAWGRIEGKTALRHDDLEKARALSDRLLVAVATRDQAPDEVGEAAVTRQRAYTLFFRAYDEARSAIAYLRRHEGDVEAIAPSLFSGRGGHRTKGADQAPDPPVIPLPTPPASPTASAPADVPAPTTAVASLGAAVGMPGSSPFL